MLTINKFFLFVLITITMAAHTTTDTYGGTSARVTNTEGKKSQLLMKVITTRFENNIREQPSQQARVVKSVTGYNILFPLEIGTVEIKKNGFYNVAGKPDGPSIGWIHEDDVQLWSTRYLMKPLVGIKDSTFTIKEQKTGKDVPYSRSQAASSRYDYSFILNAPENGNDDDGPFDVAFCRVQIDTKGVGQMKNQIRNSKLEVCFVIEDYDYLTEDLGNGTVRDSVLALSGSLRDAYDGQAVPVRFGFIKVTDNNKILPPHVWKPQIVQPLTEDLSQWSASLRKLEGVEWKGDAENDGLSGIDMAVNRLNWSDNSSKHVIYLGFAPFQKFQGNVEGPRWQEGPPDGPPLPNHYRTWRVRRAMHDDAAWRNWALKKDSEGLSFSERYHGNNTCGKWINLIQDEAFRSGKTVIEEALRRRTLHAIHIGKRMTDEFTAKELKDGKEQNQRMQAIFGGMSPADQVEFFAKAGEKGGIYYSYMLAIWRMESFPIYDEAAQNQMKELATEGKYQGFYDHLAAEKGAPEVERVKGELKARLDEAIKVIDDVAYDRNINTDKKNAGEVAQPIYDMVAMTKADLKLIGDDPILRGKAVIHDKNSGKAVAEKRIMVSRDELTRLDASLQGLYDNFKDLSDTRDRQNKGDVLTKLQKSLANAAAGQQIKADTNLKDLITDLPLKTDALDLDGDDIAIMSTEDFDTWLSDLRDVQSSLRDLLKGDAKRWTRINSVDDDTQEYGFLALHQLP